MTDEKALKRAKETDRQQALLGMRIVGDFGATLALPAVLLTLAGKALDVKYGTRPLFIIVGLVLAAIFSGMSIVRKAKAYGKAYEEINKKK